MFKKILSAVVAITMVMGMCSCSEQSSGEPGSLPTASQYEPSQPQEPIADTGGGTVELTANYSFSQADSTQKNDADFIKGLNSFSVELFKNTVKGDLAQDGKNTLVLPESVAFAMGMTMNGANGNTLSQIQQVMCGGVDTDKFNRNMNLLISNAHSNNTEDSKLNIANSIWVKDNDNLVLTEQFALNCKQMYNAELFRTPFDKSTLEKLNGWVNDKTDKMIPKLLDRFEGNEIMCLVNAVAFDSKWENQYEDDDVRENCEFTNAKGDKVDCTMLCSTEKQYIQNGRATGFVKNYKGGKYAFMAVLPNENTSVSNYVSSMTGSEIADLYAGRTTEYDVYTRLPKFKFDYGAELGNTLRSMGITDAFADNADFSKMFENTDCAINRVIHKTHIELDANGTKAAAATAITMRENAAMVTEEPKTVILDRPFVFAIMDTQTGLPVFLGTVCDPSVQ